MHPFCLRHLPRRGRFALRSASELINISRHSAAKTSPSGGSTAVGGNRGAFPTGRRPGFMVFAASGSAAAKGGIYTHRRQAIPHPLNPPAGSGQNLLNLLNPWALRARPLWYCVPPSHPLKRWDNKMGKNEPSPRPKGAEPILFPQNFPKKVLDRVTRGGYYIHIFRQPNELKQAMNETKGLLS